MEKSMEATGKGSSQLKMKALFLLEPRHEGKEENQALSYVRATPTNHPSAYKECTKNHAATLDGHAVDGCGEFMPYIDSLTCAACGCHRNFHRRQPDLFTTTVPLTLLDIRRPHSPFPPPHKIQFRPCTFLTCNTVVVEQDHNQASVAPLTGKPVGKKRFRTKFTKLQKTEMYNFSEKVGWKLQGCDEVEVRGLCKDVGITRGVLRAWMHNNKCTLGKKDYRFNESTNMKRKNNGSTSTSSSQRCDNTVKLMDGN